MRLPAPNRLAVTQLEARDTPAATQLTDIMPGIWGSYPLNITPSGQTLFFSADNGHGYELYSSDGTTAGTKLVKDIKPGLGGSNPTSFRAAGNGVVFFTANDGTGEILWRSDGTAAGTFKAVGLPPGTDHASGGEVAGLNGELVFVTRTVNTPNRVAWWKTDGVTNALLKDFGNELADYAGRSPAVKRVGDKLEMTWQTVTGLTVVWETDGTAAGTKVQQQNLTANSPTTGHVALQVGAQVAPGQFVFASDAQPGQKSSVWVGDGQSSASRQLLKVFDGVYANYVQAINGKAFFSTATGVNPQPADAGLWETDGTAAGTKKFVLPAGAGRVMDFYAYGDKLMIHVLDPHPTRPGTSKLAWYVSDGTTAGTTKLVPPGSADTSWTFVGHAPAGEQNPKAFFLFQDSISGNLYRTDGTPGGWVAVDTTGLPARTASNYRYPVEYWSAGSGLVLAGATAPGAYFKGAVYFPGRTDVQRPELWKWDLAPTVSTTPVAEPKVTGVVVNDGAAQRSMVTKITVNFDQAVALGTDAITVRRTDGFSVQVNVQTAVVNGKTVATVTFAGPFAVGGSIADGAYTLRVHASRVTAAGVPMAEDATLDFFRLFGDLDGDRLYNKEARWMAAEKVGATTADPRYDARFDFNADGLIDKGDELEMARRWFKTV
jgi:ELWxxDGT repeat protein